MLVRIALGKLAERLARSHGHRIVLSGNYVEVALAGSGQLQP
jgi:hypothetical protein